MSELLPLSFQLKSGQNCTFRRAVAEDAEELCLFVPRVDAETDFLNRFPGEFEMSVEQERAFIRDYADDQRAILFVAQIRGRIIGTAGASVLKLRRYQHHAELGLSVFKEYWGPGIGRRMTECILEWGNRRGLRKMYLRVFEHNDRAIALYRSLGFEMEGRLRDDSLCADGSYGDTLIMGRFYAELPG